MRKRSLLRLMLLPMALILVGISAHAGSITEEEAAAKAAQFLQNKHFQSGGKRHAPVRQQQLVSVPAGEQSLYVFNIGDDGGFVIVSGDDRTRPILGYTDSGSFSTANVPPALRQMLAIYARQISMLGSQDVQADSVAAARSMSRQRRISGTMSDVSPLMTTTWDQGAPYNDYCPTQQVGQSQEYRTALTGCVATAMAQIANYHKYPTSQVPTLEPYVSAKHAINVTAWGATTFDWNNMLDSYSGQSTDAQKAAVATLMRYCGQAAQMDYGFELSGTYDGNAHWAFINKLGYSSEAKIVLAASYSQSGWEDLIYKELSEGRPVYYSALNGSEKGPQCGGHAFVIDGYRADGNFFHVNWGWGGAANGYFGLFALDTGAPESAPTATGWHYFMEAIVGLAPEAVNTAKLVKDASGSYLISTDADWNELATNLEVYNGGSFKLTSDISVTTMVGTENQPFSGTFDGQGHTLNVNIASDSWGAAPFSFVADGITIKHLKTTGTVTCSGYHAGGLIGSSPRDQDFDVSIVGCEVAVTVNGSDYAGGFIGHARCMQPVFTDCVFSGSINDCREHACFVGWKEHASRPVYVNCLSVPTSFNRDSSYDFSHPGNGGSTDHATLTNCYSYFASGFRLAQGTAATASEMADGTVAHGLQSGWREWTDGQVWGQQIGTDAVPVLTADVTKGVYKVSFAVDGQVLKTVITNGSLGEKMPAGEDFGLANATFTSNNAPFTASTPVSSDVAVSVAGTWAFTQTLGTPANGSLSVNNNSCMPGTLKKVTAAPAAGHVVSAVTVTDANGQAVPVTPVSNNANEFVFVFPKSSVTVNAEFVAGETEPVRFINGGMTLSLWADQPWTADTWTIWNSEYSTTLGTPPADAFGHQWYEENYMLTNSDADVQPNGNKIVWENHMAPFGSRRNYDYARACGAPDDGPNNFYMRRVFTFNAETVPEKLYLRCNYDDAPVKVYLNGTLIYENNNQDAGSYQAELTPQQSALIHTDGTANVLAVRGSQGGGDYYLDCGLYDPTALSYEVTDGQTLRVMRNEFLTGDITVPQKVDYGGTTYTVTSVADDAVRDLPYITSMSLPSTVSSLPSDAFRDCGQLKYVKSHFPVYQVRDGIKTLIAAPLGATTFDVADDCSRIFDNAFKFTSQLQTLTLPRPLTAIGTSAFAGCTALTTVTSYARPVPQTQGNAFDGLDKSGVTVRVYALALEGYQQSWGKGFQYVTMTDPQPLTLTIAVTTAGTLGTLIAEAAAEQQSTVYDVVGITVTGTINQDDLSVLSSMCTGVYSLSTIDLSGATIEGNSIGNRRFSDREKLTAIALPTSLTYIGSNAFTDCSQLQTVAGLEGLSDANNYNSWDVFRGTAITTPVYGGSVFLYLPPAITGSYDMPAGIQQITAGALRDSKLSSITLPASLTTIGDDAFQDNPNLTDIYCYATTPPTCISGVWEYGFDRSACTVHVPASAVDDYQSANEWKDMGRIVAMVAPGDLVDLTLNVPTAGSLDETFFSAAVSQAGISDAVLIRNITVTGSLNAADVAYLNTLPNTLYNIEQLDLSGATIEGNTIGERMFYQTLFKAIILPTDVTAIGREAFRDSRRLYTVTLPGGLQSIGSYAFAGSGLTGITIPDAVTTLGDRGVQGCASLKTVTIGHGVTLIPDCWAENSENIEEITLGKRVTAINWRAFRGPNIKHLYSYAYIPPAWGTDVPYSGLSSDVVLHVYDNSVSRYEAAGVWKDFPTIVGDLGTYPTFELAVNVAEMGTFSQALAAAMTAAGCDDLRDITKLTVSGTMNQGDLNYIRDNMGAYLDALDLGAVTMHNNTIGDQALRGCAFRELILPATLQRFADWRVLEGCANLTTIHIPSGVKFICPNFLNGATSLETVTGGEGVTEMDNGNGMYFDNSPALQSPVILGSFFFRLPLSTAGAYEVPEGVTAIARDGMWHVTGLTALTLPESVSRINGNAFAGDENLKDIYYYATELPVTDWAFNDFNREACTLHVYKEMVELFQSSEVWSAFNIVGDLGAMPNTTPMAEADYADLCALYTAFGGSSWQRKWITTANVQTASRWPGVTFDAEGYVTAIDLRENGLNGDVSHFAFTGMTRLTNLNLSRNAVTGDILPLAESLPQGCTLNVERQDLGHVGTMTLYEACNFTGLPSIAYWRSDAQTLVTTLIGVGGVCQFYHEGTEATKGQYWDCYIHADGRTSNNFKFYWPSPVTVECFYPHHFTFTYRYAMGDANMDDKLDVLDLQSTLNYSNGRSSGLFNFYAADTYGQDDDINVQDIVSTVNILLAQPDNTAGARAQQIVNSQSVNSKSPEACVRVENGQVVLYTTRPVAALDLRLAGIDPSALNWQTEAMGFATAVQAVDGGTRAIVYSLSPREIGEGRTVLATFDTAHTPRLAAAVLSDSEARLVSVGTAVPTGISEIYNLQNYNLQFGDCYDLQGRKVSAPTRKGLYIDNGKKVVIK